MSYETKHVRNAGTDPETITSLPTFTELLTNPDLAALYTAIHRSESATAPDLTASASVSKKTVYEYLRRLTRAGLVTETDEHAGTRVYEAADFEWTLTVRDVEVSITPALVEAVAHEDEYPVIARVLDDHGIVTFALVYDLVTAHSDGDVTTRQISQLTGLSSGTTYDIVESMYAIFDLGDDDRSATTFTPDDFADEIGEIRDESDDV